MTIELHFHLGAHKTAISALKWRTKSICNKAYLKNNQVSYTGSNIFKTPFGCLAAWKKTTERELNDLQSYIDEEYQKNGITKFFIIHENILGKMLGVEKGIYNNTFRFIENVKKLKNVKLKFTLFVRDQASFVESTYKFRVRNDYKGSLDNYLNDIDIKKLSWVNIAEEFRKNDMDLDIYPYDFLKSKGYENKLHEIFKNALPNTKPEDFILTKENESLNDFTNIFIKHFGEGLKKQSHAKVAISSKSSKIIPDDLEEINDSAKFNQTKKELLEAISNILQEYEITSFSDLENNIRAVLKEVLDNHNKGTEPFKLSDKQRNKILKIYEKDNEKLFGEYITDDFGVVWDKPKTGFSLSNLFKKAG